MAPPRKPRPHTFALADLVGKAIDPVLAKQGFGASDIVLHWEEIVGERLARVCEPMKLQWPSRGTKGSPDRPVEPASLQVRVEGGFAIELQHLAPLVVERINAHLGWRCVGRLLLRQGPIGLNKVERPKRPVDDPVARAEAERESAAITEEPLRAALVRLGSRVIGEKRSRAGS